MTHSHTGPIHATTAEYPSDLPLAWGQPQRTVAHVLRKACRDHAARIAVVEGKRRLTYAELERRATSIATWLHGRGLSTGTRVGIVSRNCLEFVIADLAIQLGAFTRVGVSPRLTTDEVVGICNDAGIAALFVDESWAARAPEICMRTAVSPLIISFGAGVPGVVPLVGPPSASPGAALPEAAEESAALLAYTSGTTGKPKGAVISQRAAFNVCRQVALALPDVGAGDSILHTAPLAHFVFAIVLSSLAHGGTQHVMAKFDAAALLDVVETEKIAIIPMVPTQVNTVVSEQLARGRDVSSVRCIPYSAAPIAVGRLRAAIEVFGPVFVQLYAQSEVPPPLTVLSKQDHQRALADGDERLLMSAGRPLPYVDVKIVDIDGNDVAPGDLGEILCRSETIMDGYWQNPTQTAQAFDNDGWLATGDVGRLSSDGYLTIVDRRKSLIITGGYNVYPAEVERTIQQLPWVAEVAVIGIPDEHWGEAITAVVVVDQTVVPDGGSEALSGELIEHCRAHLAGYRVPKHVKYSGPLPRNAVGKVLTRLVREPYWAARTRPI
jgi:acyl-CoA synthetase (AMP-forming)/AMP-acid ligase II